MHAEEEICISLGADGDMAMSLMSRVEHNPLAELQQQGGAEAAQPAAPGRPLPPPPPRNGEEDPAPDANAGKKQQKAKKAEGADGQPSGGGGKRTAREKPKRCLS